jgi:catechol 2,3-dioxygenase-like lactoylglutathione lyase family enzyme
MKVTHTRLLVDDSPACFRFYRDVLGLTPVFGDEASGYAEFDTGGVTLALFDRRAMAGALGASADEAQGATTRDRVVVVLGVGDVDATVERLRAEGVTFETEPTDRPDWGIRTAHCRDPDGTLVELNSPLA